MNKKLTKALEKYEKLREECEAVIKEIISDWCKKNNAIFSYGYETDYRIVVEKDEINDDCCLIDNPDITCYYESVYDYWYYDTEPPVEVSTALSIYEDMFGYWYQSDCNRGIWSGI